ncbi:MAG: sulfite exporter TauE/SafE family protein [Spirochaetota bacterium]
MTHGRSPFAAATLLLLALCVLNPEAVSAAPLAQAASSLPPPFLPWWAWIGLLFATTFLIGIVAVLGGVGGGVLFIPIVGTFFPFHADYVRCVGLLIALSGSLSAGPLLIRRNLANLRLSIPTALIASTASIFGAHVGLALPARFIQLATAILMSGVLLLLLSAKSSAFPDVPVTDSLGRLLGLGGVYRDDAEGRDVSWKVRHTAPGFALFILVGFMAGMFGLGAGWANVPVLNLLMGTPLKIAVATSNLVIAVSSMTAAWIYINKGALISVIAVPAIVGMIAGTKIGARLLSKVDSKVVRKVVLTLLAVSILLGYFKGFGLIK